MRRPGLVAKRILRKGGGLATYWIRPQEGRVQLQRLAKAKLALYHSEQKPPTPQAPKPLLSPERKALVASPATRRREGKGLPSIAPPEIVMQRKLFDASSVPAGEAFSSKHVSAVLRDNQAQIKRMGTEIDAAFVNAKGTRVLDAVADVQVTFVLGASVAGAYNAQTGDMILRKSLATKMLEPAINDTSPTYDQIRATQIWTHEQLHAASNKERPQVEPDLKGPSPNRWLEEATTELLSHHYNDVTVTALSGKPVAKTSPLVYALTLDGDVALAVDTGVSYVNQSMRFANVVSYMTGVNGRDKIEDINRVVLGYAAEVKKRGKDRYDYLSEEMTAAHGIDKTSAKYKDTIKGVKAALEGFMGKNAPSSVQGETENAVEAVVKAAILEAHKDLADAALAMGTPLARETSSAEVTSIPPASAPKRRSGRRRNLKVSL